VDDAVGAAKAAFKSWSATSDDERRSVLHRIADLIDVNRDGLARILTKEQGKPLGESGFEMMHAAGIIRAFADMPTGDKVIKENAGERLIEQRSPLGVVVAITPWNTPIIMLALKLAPALRAGNTLVVKPAPTTPLSTLRLGELLADAVPAGVVNIIVDANDLGDALTSHPDVAKVSFTGSTATGKRVFASAADSLKRLTLELGGNDAAIVLDDMDPAEAAQRIFGAAMMNAGQICLAPKRVYVPDRLYDRVCDELAKLASEAVVGDGLVQGTQIGPVQNKAQFEKVKAYLAEARAIGNIIAGGAALNRPGYFIQPTIVRDIADDAKLVREEQFGPVLPVLSYSTEDDLIERVNDSDYGLGGTVWTRDPERGIEVARRVETGTIWVNKYMDMQFDVPYGGAKQSGIGVELGLAGLHEFTQVKIINAALG
jgi:acyl-CoA reductase-like NAD-dependent aldehyde dehydrogenase